MAGIDTQKATQPVEERRAHLMARAAEIVSQARSRIPFWRERLPELPEGRPLDETTLAALPVLRKSELPGLQARSLPFGGLTDLEPGAFPHLFLSPGPICEPGPRRADGWNLAYALQAAGLERGDVVLNTFGYHLTPAGLMMHEGARALGCAVIPAGGGNTEQIVQAMRAFSPSAYIGTADYLNILLEAADRAGAPVALKRALMSGAAVPGSLRKVFSARGIEVFELYGTAELGIVAYETPAHEGFVVNEDIILEIVEPGGQKPMQDGEIGEVVVTLLEADYPLIRFGTGDLSATLPGRSPCGRTNTRLRGWLGRADDAVKVKGMFIRPDQLRDLVARSEGLVGKARFVVDRENERDRLTLEVEGEEDAAARARIEALIREATRLGGSVRFVPPGSLPADGKAIVDERPIG